MFMTHFPIVDNFLRLISNHKFAYQYRMPILMDIEERANLEPNIAQHLDNLHRPSIGSIHLVDVPYTIRHRYFHQLVV